MNQKSDQITTSNIVRVLQSIFLGRSRGRVTLRRLRDVVRDLCPGPPGLQLLQDRRLEAIERGRPLLDPDVLPEAPQRLEAHLKSQRAVFVGRVGRSVRLVGRLVRLVRLVGRLVRLVSIGWLVRLGGWLLVDCVADWLIGWLVVLIWFDLIWLAGFFVGWLVVGWLGCWLIGCVDLMWFDLIGWLVRPFVSWLVGWLVDLGIVFSLKKMIKKIRQLGVTRPIKRLLDLNFCKLAWYVQRGTAHWACFGSIFPFLRYIWCFCELNLRYSYSSWYPVLYF